MKKSSFLPFALAAVILSGLHCSHGLLVSAGSSEQGNARTVFGSVVDSLGKSAARAIVRLLPSSFDPVADSTAVNNLSTITDDSGRFRIDQVPQGTYNLNAIGQYGAQRSLCQSVIVVSSDLSVGLDTLRAPSAITINASSSAASDSSYVYVPGTDLYALIGPSDIVTLTAPHATVSVNFAKKVTATSVLEGTILDTVAVPEGKDTVIIGKSISLVGESDRWQAIHPEWLWCDDFEVSRPLSASYADIAANGMSIDSSDAYAGRYALRQLYTAGQVDAGWIIRVDTAGYPDHVFMRFYFKLGAGFSGTSLTMGGIRSRERFGAWNTKYSFALNIVSGAVNATMYGPMSSQANSTGYLFEDNTGFVLIGNEHTGRWVPFEMELQLNTSGNADGACRVWVDDTLRIEHSGIDVRGSDTSKINEAILAPYFNTGSPKAQSLYYDNLVISTQKIGPAQLIKFQ